MTQAQTIGTSVGDINSTATQFPTAKTYETGDARKTILAFVFLLLLPFLISIPVMILLRAVRGFWGDALSAVTLGVLFGCWMLFLLLHVVSAFRTRIEVNEHTVKLQVPHYHGPNPGLKYIRRELPLTEIKAVETRGEIYKAVAVPVLVNAASIVTEADERITLGYINEKDVDAPLPYPEIAAHIAHNANIALTERGCVDCGNQIKALRRANQPDWGQEDISESDLAEYRRRNHWLMLGLAMLLVGLTAVGFLYDLFRSGFFGLIG